MKREEAERLVDEARERSRGRLMAEFSMRGHTPITNGPDFDREELTDAILAAVAEERERCSGIVVKMRNQRQVYRDIIGNPKAQLPKHGHWADPFFEEAERMTREQEAVAERDRVWRVYLDRRIPDWDALAGHDDDPPPDRQLQEPA